MGRIAIFLMAVLGQMACFGQAVWKFGTPTPHEEYFSTSGRFKLVIELDRLDVSRASEDGLGMTAEVFDTANGEGSVKWRRNIPGKASYFNFDSVFVSDSGSFFALVQRMEPVRVFGTDATKDFKTADEPNLNYEIVEMDESGGRELLRIWNIQDDQWKAFSLPQIKQVNVDAGMAKDFNERTRQRILTKVSRSEAYRLQQKIQSVSPQLGRVAAMVGKNEKLSAVEDLEYEFLTARRVPEDRSIFEKMWAKKPPGQEPPALYSWCGTGRIAEDNYSFSVEDNERRRADYLLSIWDGKTKSDDGPLSISYGEKLFRLGAVSGKVLLPAPALRRAGVVRIYLIAEGTESGRWIDRTETERLDCQLPDASGDLNDLVDQIAFDFGSVTPGRYFVKAIWDKRPPLIDRERGGPGDYESKLYGPVEVKAGATVNDVNVDCSNRHKEGENYYKADAMELLAWKKTGDLSPESFDPQVGFYFSRPASHWITQTNLAPKPKEESLARVAFKGGLADERGRRKSPQETALHFYFAGGPERPRKSELILMDEHGCQFHGRYGYEGTDRRQYFPIFPRSAELFRIVNAAGSFDFTVKNLVKTNSPALTIEALPAVREFGGLQMKLESVTADEDRPEVKASFFEGSASAKGVRVTDCLFIDRDGVPLDLANMCLREPAIMVQGSIVAGAERAPIRIDLKGGRELVFDEFYPIEIATNLFGAEFRIIGIAWGVANFRHQCPGEISISGGEFEMEFTTGGKARMVSKVPRLIVEGPVGTQKVAVYLKRGVETIELNLAKPDVDLEARGYWFPEIGVTKKGSELQILAAEKRPFSIVVERPKELVANAQKSKRIVEE